MLPARAARSAIRNYVTLSPLNLSPHLSGRTDCQLYLKMENMQRTGSYKDRGSMNTVLSLGDKEKAAGVIAASAGNHAQGLAFAAQCNNTHATIVMPHSFPKPPTALRLLCSPAAGPLQAFILYSK